jgi:hypothetical protein
MADKKDKDEKDEEKDEAASLVAITDDPAYAEKGAKDDDDAESGEEDAAGDERLGASDEETADEERSKERKRERKSRSQRAREGRDRAERKYSETAQENQYLRAHNERLDRRASEMAQRLDALEGSTIDGRISQFKAALSKADQTVAEAITAGDGTTAAEATRIRDDLRDGLKDLERSKAATAERNDSPREEVDPALVANARDWHRRNPWFDFNRSDEDSAIAGAIDDTMMREKKLDPRTEAYWKEFDRRIAKRLPKRAVKSNGHADDEDDDVDDPSPEPKARKNGGPRFRRGGADRQLGANQVYLSRDRLEALKEAGIEEGTPQYQRMLKRYRDHDHDKSADAAR